jgi:hypothetical protein
MDMLKKWLGLELSLVAVFAVGFAGWVMALIECDPTTTWKATPMDKSFEGDCHLPVWSLGVSLTGGPR